MTLVFSDDFNRANSDSLGGNWVENSGDWDILSNKMRCATAGLVANTSSIGSADYQVEAAVTIAANGPGLRGRIVDSSNYYLLHMNTNTDDYELYRCVSGGFTLMGSYDPGVALDGTTHTVKLSMQGTTLKGYVDGTERISLTNSQFSAEGDFGARGFTAGVDFEDFAVYDFVQTLTASPVTIPLVVPTHAFTRTMQASPVTMPIAIPTATLSMLMDASPVTIPLVVPTSVLTPGAVTLAPSPVAIPLVVPTSVLTLAPLSMDWWHLATPDDSPYARLGVFSRTDQAILDAAHMGNGVVWGCRVTAKEPIAPDVVHVDVGAVCIRRRVYSVAAQDVTLTAASASLDRVALIACHLDDVSGNAVTPVATDGTAHEVPDAPDLDDDQVSLAFVYQPAGLALVRNEAICDKRVPIGYQPMTVVKAADESITSDAVFGTDHDSELKLYLPANTTWGFALLGFMTTQAIPDFKATFIWPSGADGRWVLNSSSDGWAAEVATSGGGPVVLNGSASFKAEGSLIVGATPGELQFEWAQNTSSGNPTTLLKGSALSVYPA